MLRPLANFRGSSPSVAPPAAESAGTLEKQKYLDRIPDPLTLNFYGEILGSLCNGHVCQVLGNKTVSTTDTEEGDPLLTSSLSSRSFLATRW